MKITFYAPSKFARQIQLFVIKYDGYFVENPMFLFSKEAQFKIGFDHNNATNSRKFMNKIDILKQPYV